MPVNRRGLIEGAGAVALAAGLPGAVEAGAARKPNVLFIMADDLGYADVGCYGSKDNRTPNIDRLYREGLHLTESYSNSAVCTATRVGLITGRYQYRLPVGNEEPLGKPRGLEIGLPPDHPTWPRMMQAAGYATSLIGKWHVGYPPKFGPTKSGYDRFFGITSGGVDYFKHTEGGATGGGGDLWEGEARVEREGYMTDLLADRAIQEIGAARAAAKPFFISLHFTAPHWPWEGPGDAAKAAALTNFLDQGARETYTAMVESMDANIGRVLAALRRNGVERDTIVVFTSDNGGERYSDTWPFSGMKTELLEGGIRVPIIVRWPARIRAGSTSGQVALSMDFAPTILAAAGGAPPAGYAFDGENLLDVFTGAAPARPRDVFWRYKIYDQAAVRSGDLKYLRMAGKEYLFDVAADPRERTNLAQRRPADFAALKQKWATWNAGMPAYAADSQSASNRNGLPDRY